MLILVGSCRRMLVALLVGLLGTTACFSVLGSMPVKENISKDDLRTSEVTNNVAEASENSFSIKDNSTDSSSNTESGNIIVRLENNAKSCDYEKLMQFVNEKDGQITNTISENHEIIALSVEIPQAEMSSFMLEVNSDGLARFVEPNVKFKTQLTPNDPFWTAQWGPRKIEADWVWNTTLGDPSVLVAVIDTGIDYNHPDLKANYVPLGYDWVNNDTDPMDDQGHGTHCAGIIAASINNGIGTAGIARIHLMAEKALNANGSGYTSDLANAIIHATDQGADIISMSWGGYGTSKMLHEAVKYAYSKGVLLIAAAGNEATSLKLYPAAYEEVIAVSATDEHDNPAYFSNYGDWVELAAPGVNILSTISETHDKRLDYPYDSLSGTSMACPHVAGVAALLKSQFPYATTEWLRLRMRCTADDLGEPGFDVHYGYGRINARRTLEEPLIEHDLLILNWETPAYVEPSETAAINITIFNFGKTERNVTVQLIEDGNVVDFASIDSLESDASTTVVCHWTPTNEQAYNLTAFIAPVIGEANIANNVKSKEIIVSSRIVALFENFDPWGYPADEKALTIYGIPCAVFDSSTFGSVNLSKFLKVVIAADQDQSFYLALDAYRWWFNDYVSNGGILEIHAADDGANGGFAPGYLPGGLIWKHRPSDDVKIVNSTHPIVTTPNSITEEELDGWGISSHGYFFGYPANAQIIVIDEHYGRPVHLVFSYGSGLVIASGLTLEWGYKLERSRILENTLLYTVSGYPTIVHDVAIINITLPQNSVYAGTLVNISVVAANEGNTTETFRVTANHDDIPIATQTIFNLTKGKKATVTFTWDTKGSEQFTLHTISAKASLILNEANVSNNIFVDGNVKIRKLGDINDDDKVDILDLVLVAHAYGSKPGDANWNALADLTPQLGVIDILDIVTLAYHYAS